MGAEPGRGRRLFVTARIAPPCGSTRFGTLRPGSRGPAALVTARVAPGAASLDSLPLECGADARHGRPSPEIGAVERDA